MGSVLDREEQRRRLSQTLAPAQCPWQHCWDRTVLPPRLKPSGEELTPAILSCTVSEQPSEDIDTNCGPFKSVMY